MWIPFLWGIACFSGSENPVPPSETDHTQHTQTEAPPPPPQPAVPATTPGPKKGAPLPTDCPPNADDTPATTLAVPMGNVTVLAKRCVVLGTTQTVEARIEGTEWRWTASDEANQAEFEWIGHDEDGNGYMALRFWACPFDGCRRTSFFQIGNDMTVKQLGDATSATEWSLSSSGLMYTAKVGYSEGYSIASASQQYRWQDDGFTPNGEPGFQIEYRSWPCEDADIPAVESTTGTETGHTVRIKQGQTIEVVGIGDALPLGQLFEYRVDGTRFWAKNWEQTCAG